MSKNIVRVAGFSPYNDPRVMQEIYDSNDLLKIVDWLAWNNRYSQGQWPHILDMLKEGKSPEQIAEETQYDMEPLYVDLKGAKEAMMEAAEDAGIELENPQN